MGGNVKLETVAFFWRNDQPDGIGAKVGGFEGLEKSLLGVCTNYIKMYEAEPDKTVLVRDLLAQLAEFGADKKKFNTPRQIIIAFGNVWLLETIGAIRPDEFNGCIIGWSLDETGTN